MLYTDYHLSFGIDVIKKKIEVSDKQSQKFTIFTTIFG